MSDLGTTDYPVTRAVLHNLGIDPDKDVQWIAVGAGVSAGVALQRGVIDALAYFDTGFGQIDAAGIAMRMLPRPPDVPLIGGLFISATADFLKDNRKTRGRLRPRGQQVVRVPARQPGGRRPGLPQALPGNRAARRERSRRGQVDPVRRQAAHPALPPALSEHQDGLHPRVGTAARCQVPRPRTSRTCKPLFTNDMIDEINNYDRDKIIAEAKAYKS